MDSFAVRRTDLGASTDHPVLRAWRTVGSKVSGPIPIETLAGNLDTETSVYRLRGPGRFGGVIAKRSARSKLEYEARLYSIVESLGVSAIHCYGFVGDPNPDWGWLFLEEIGGQPCSKRDPEQKRLVSEWLGAVHGISSLHDLAGTVQDRDARHYLESLRTGRSRIMDNISNPALDRDARALLQKVVEHYGKLESNWGEMERVLDGGPQCLVHGDFVPKNIRLLAGGSSHGVYVMDWETGGWGTPAHDIGGADVDVYWKTVAPYWPTVDKHDIQTYWDVGWILREIPSIEWASWGLEFDWLDTILIEFEVYEKRLAKGLTRAGWA